MNFLTKEQVAVEAKKGKLEAMQCSLKHHEQGRDASAPELVRATVEHTFSPTVRNECACCAAYYPSHDQCPFGDKGCHGACCESNWFPVDKAWDNFRSDYSNANFEAFQKAETKLCKYIEGKIAEEESKSKSKGGKGECFTCKHHRQGDIQPCLGCAEVAYNGSNWESKAEKPKLEHGSSGILDAYGPYCAIKIFEDMTVKKGDILLAGEKGLTSAHANQECYLSQWTEQFNFLTDLKRNSENLREFEIMAGKAVDYQRNSKLSIGLSVKPPNLLYIAVKKGNNNVVHFTEDQATEIHQKLGQLIAFAKREQAKKSK